MHVSTHVRMNESRYVCEDEATESVCMHVCMYVCMQARRKVRVQVNKHVRMQSMPAMVFC